MPGTCSLTVVVPVYGAEASLVELTERLLRVLPDLAEEYEVLFVNDASPDDSWSVIELLSDTHPEVQGIDLSRNYGQHNALLAGIRRARYEVVVTMDDDLQHRPEQIATLLSALAPDVDLVYGYAAEEEHGVARSLASRATKLALASALGLETARNVSAFRVFRTRLRRAFEGNQDSSVSIDVLLSWGTTRVAAVPVPMDKRRYGTSGYTVRKLVTHALNMLTGYSTAPLRAVTFLGLSMAGFGMMMLTVVVGRYVLSGPAQPGFAFIASTVALFSGAQLFCLGMLGEYIGRMHFRSMGRPTYTVRTASDDEPDESGSGVP